MLGVDRADKLIGTARAIAAAHAIGNAGFEVMSLDALTLPDKSVDAAISQFAFLSEGDVPASAREPSRVLKDGAPFSVAAWDSMELNTLFSRAAQVLERHVPAQLLPDFGYLTSLAAPGLRERLLRGGHLHPAYRDVLLAGPAALGRRHLDGDHRAGPVRTGQGQPRQRRTGNRPR